MCAGFAGVSLFLEPSICDRESVSVNLESAFVGFGVPCLFVVVEIVASVEDFVALFDIPPISPLITF